MSKRKENREERKEKKEERREIANNKIFLLSLFTFLSFVGCTMDNLPNDDGGDGMRLAAYMDGAAPGSVTARSTYSDTGGLFDSNAEVKVRIIGSASPYTFKADGSSTATFTPDPMLYWGKFGGSIDAYAYYPGDYSFPVDQSDPGKLAKADYLFAGKKTGITKSNFNTDHQFEFKHKTAKVTATLAAGIGTPNVAGATVKFYGYTAVDTFDHTGDTAAGAITGKTPGEITPYKNGLVHTALLIPRAYNQENFLEVDISGKKYYWKPVSQALEAGHSYALAITVNNDKLSVAVTNGVAWNTGSEAAVTAYTSLTYDKGVTINGVKWATRNVDAVGTFAPAPESGGKFYQWNRKVAWSATDPGVDQPVNGWDTSTPGGTEWTTENDPSPAGWRVPTKAELESLLEDSKVTRSQTSQNSVNGWKFTDKTSGASVFFPVVGIRISFTGELKYVTGESSYWGNNAEGSNAYRLYLGSASVGITNKRYGIFVRAVAKQ